MRRSQATCTCLFFTAPVSRHACSHGSNLRVTAFRLSCQVHMRGSRSSGYGFVAVASSEAADRAIEALNGKDLEGRPVAVAHALSDEQKEKTKKTKRRVGRRGTKAVPGEVTEAEANGEAEKPTANGAEGGAPKPKKKKFVSNIHFLESRLCLGLCFNNICLQTKRKPNGVSTENGVHTEDSADGATAPAVEATKKKSPKPKRASKPPRRPVGEEPTGEQSKTTLFVANLPFTVDDASLSAIFADVGFTVNSARVVRRRWGNPRRSKGYGFVDVGDEEQQAKAIAALQGKELEGGRQIAVKIAVNSTHEDAKDAEDEEKDQEAAAIA